MSLTADEISLIQMLGECHDEFTDICKFPDSVDTNQTHIDDEAADFNTHIHALQRIVMSRSAIRAHPSIFKM